MMMRLVVALLLLPGGASALSACGAPPERLACRIKGYYPFPTRRAGPLALVFRDTHQAIRVTTSDGAGTLLMDFMTEGGQAHPVWYDEATRWRFLLGGTIRGEVRVREAGTSSTKLARLRTFAEEYDRDHMHLYANNCRVFCARVRREAERLNAEDDDDDNDAPPPLLADLRLALALAKAAALPALYPVRRNRRSSGTKLAPQTVIFFGGGAWDGSTRLVAGTSTTGLLAQTVLEIVCKYLRARTLEDAREQE